MSAEAIVIGGGAVVAVILSAVVAVLLRIFRRSESHLLRITVAAAVSVFVVLSPLAVEQLTLCLNRMRGAAYVMIDPGLAVKFAPAIVAAIVAGVMARTRPRDDPARWGHTGVT